jgi:nitrogen fixation protein NifZ
MRLSDEIELDSAPLYDLGDCVRVRKLIRNDGTFPGKDIGFHLAKKGDVGYVIGIGTYLQQAYIYSIHFLKTNYVVGCLSKELEPAKDPYARKDSNSADDEDALCTKH